MRRIAIIGASGSGKTTLGQRLAEKLGLVAVDLDELNWEPGWQEASPAEFGARLERALEAPGWVVSGNYSRVQEYYLERADTLIFLDYSFLTVLGRLLKRTFARVVHHQSCCNGNYETLRLTFSRDSIVLWLFRTYRRRRQQGQRLMSGQEFSHLKRLHFRCPRATQRWLESLAP